MYKENKMSEKIKTIGYGFIGAISFTALFIILRFLLKFVPDFYIWKTGTAWFKIFGVSLYQIDIIYFIICLIFVTHGVINLFLITKENHEIRNDKTRKPDKLITDGFYEKTRHPMYGTFLIINFGLILSTRSIWGLILIGLFFIIQYGNSYIEEKNELLEIFPENYRKYQKKVSNMMFLPVYKHYILTGIILTIGGIYFTFL